MKLAVFDIDGTLTQPYPVEDACFLEALEIALGMRDVDSDWTRYPDVTDTGLVTSLCLDRRGRPPTAMEMTRFQAVYCTSFRARLPPEDGREVPGAAAFIASLRQSGDWCVTLATGNFRELADLKLTRGRMPCVDLPMATADDAISRADLVRLAIERATAHFRLRKFSHVVSVGDAPWDLRTAQEVGVPFVAIGGRCGDVPAAQVLTDYRDISQAESVLSGASCGSAGSATGSRPSLATRTGPVR